VRAVLGSAADASVTRQRAETVEEYPHDPTAFTQGLALIDDRSLLESTGLYGRSTLREVDLASGRVRRLQNLPPDVFAEGAALVGEQALQLTWKEQIAFRHTLSDFRIVDSHRYEGEGWGLCTDGRRLVMSDGSSRLTFRDPSTFGATGQVTVTVAGEGLPWLNELECVNGRVLANVWQTDTIVEIDPSDGRVLTLIDAAGLLSPEERDGIDVLNGIAYRPSTGTYLLTGKLWPKLFEVRFVEAGAPTAGAAP
jgi:glutaminyl-peptide cyclotransferase